MANPQTVAAKWVRGMQNAGQAMKDGVNAVTTAPGQRAAAQADLYRRKVNEAVESGRFQAAVGAVTLESWKKDMIDKGVAAATSRAAGAIDKVTRFQTFWQPIVQASKAQVADMPKGSPEASKARMLANFDNLVGRKYKGR